MLQLFLINCTLMAGMVIHTSLYSPLNNVCKVFQMNHEHVYRHSQRRYTSTFGNGNCVQLQQFINIYVNLVIYSPHLCHILISHITENY